MDSRVFIGRIGPLQTKEKAQSYGFDGFLSVEMALSKQKKWPKAFLVKKFKKE